MDLGGSGPPKPPAKFALGVGSMLFILLETEFHYVARLTSNPRQPSRLGLTSNR